MKITTILCPSLKTRHKFQTCDANSCITITANILATATCTTTPEPVPTASYRYCAMTEDAQNDLFHQEVELELKKKKKKKKQHDVDGIEVPQEKKKVR